MAAELELACKAKAPVGVEVLLASGRAAGLCKQCGHGIKVSTRAGLTSVGGQGRQRRRVGTPREGLGSQAGAIMAQLRVAVPTQLPC